MIVIAVLGSILAVAGAPRLQSASYLEETLDWDDPELLRFQALQAEFGSDRLVILAFGCGAPSPCESVFEREPLALVRALTEAAARYPVIETVESLANAGVLVEDGGVLKAERLPDSLETVDVAVFRDAVRRDPLIPGLLVSRDFRTTAVVVRFDPDASDAERNPVAIALIDEAQALAADAGFELYLSGDVAFTSVSDAYVRADLGILTPVMLALLAAFLFWIFRDALSVGLAIATVATPALWAFGLMGWMGTPITPVTSMLPTLVMVVGITDAVHFLVRTHELARTGTSAREVVLEVAREVGPPTSITALTSALGFLALLSGSIHAVRSFGLFAAFGIAAGWVFTFSLLPVALVHLGLRTRSEAPSPFTSADHLLGKVRTLAHCHPWRVLLVATVTCLTAGLGIARLEPENNALKIIGGDDLLFRSNEFIDERLRPPASIEVTFEPAKEVGLFAPETLRRLESVEALLQKESAVSPVVSLLPILRVANREVASGPLRIPNDRAAAAQLMLLAQLADPDAVRRVMTPDRALTRLSGAYSLGTGSARRIEADIERIRRELSEILDDHGEWSVTGSVFLGARVGELTLDTQVSSFATAFLTIFAVILLFVRSVALGTLGMIPNVFPVVVTLGVMGLTNVNLDVATAMIACIVLGVSVDDTMYFLTHYQAARRRGATTREAVAFTFSIAGKPALFCAGVLSAGFFVLGLSSFRGIKLFGLLAGFSVLLAAAAELFLMPAVLEAVRRTRLMARHPTE